jgi:arylsulfatase A-like enzyme
LRSTYTSDQLNQQRLKYDQFLATTDAAFGKFLDEIESAGLLENSYVILTSDHGESFERGYLGHAGPFVYEPGIHVPLLISAPGQRERRDFHSVTNSVDLLPTLLALSGLEVPDWCEGQVLPGYGGEQDNQRVTFSMDIKRGSAFGPLNPITLAMYQGDYKLIYYHGYRGEGSPYHSGLFELYNLKDDPEELHDLIEDERTIVQHMKNHLLDAYQHANQPIN